MLFRSLHVPIKNDIKSVVAWYRELLATKPIDVALFHVTLAVCIAFLPPWIALIDPHLLHLPMILAVVIITIRLLLRADCRNRFWQTLKQVKFMFALLLLFYIALHSIKYKFDVGWGTEASHLFRQATFASLVFIFCYIWSSPEEPYRTRLLNLFRLGTFLAVTFFISIFIYNHILLYLDMDALNIYVHEIKVINRSLEILSIFLLMMLGVALRGKKVLGLALIALIWFLSFYVVGVRQNSILNIHVDSETVQLGLPISLLVYFLALAWPKLITNIVFSGIAAVLITAPWLYQILNSVVPKLISFKTHVLFDRTAIWSASAKKILEYPWFGRGIESLLLYRDIDPNIYTKTSPPSAHNFVLQIWMDLGLLGVAFALVLVYSGWIFMRQLNKVSLPAGLATMTMIFIAASVTRSMWATWWMAAVALALLLFALLYGVSDKEGAEVKGL